MQIEELKNKLTAILGYGIEGRAVADYLVKHGVKPVLFDQRPWDQWDKIDQEEIKSKNLHFIFGPDCFKELAGFDVAFRSPGIKIADINKATEGSGKNPELTSQTEWFYDHSPAKIIGVTGTKGKGTTATLIYSMLSNQSGKKSGKTRVFLTGNIGKTQSLELLDALMPEDLIVYELSSFQLQNLKISPHIAVILMTTKEHLDYHKDLSEYLEAKSAITKFQTAEDVAVINHDYPSSMSIGSMGKGKKLFFSRSNKTKPGCYVKDDQIIVEGVLPKKTVVCGVEELQLKGRHNLENACAAVLGALSAGCSLKDIKKSLKEFKGLEHRLEFVAEKEGIYFYNDSFSTTPETAIAAIESFSDPLIVILGGSSKDSDFRPLSEAVNMAKNIKALILIGQEAGRIKDSLGGKFKGQTLTGASNMVGVFEQIKTNAASGDVVLLSPACASFDMFKNYKIRGEQFKNFVSTFSK